MHQLQSLREQLREVDRELFALVAERQELALTIGKLKLESDIPTRNFAQERIVVERAVAVAEEHGMSGKMAERIALQLIEGSLMAQEKSRVVRQASGKGQRALVIGGAGRMGGWIAGFLASQDFHVEVADPKGSESGYVCYDNWRDVELSHDVIVVAATLRNSGEILDQLAQSPPEGLIFDIASLKTPLRNPLFKLAKAGARVTSVHPMFGPETELLSGRHVIFVDVGVPEATASARQLFEDTMVKQMELDIDLHDRVVAYVLGLTHAVNIAFMAALAQSGETVPNLTGFSSTTFDAQLKATRIIAQGNPNLYCQIQSLNEYGIAPLEALEAQVRRLVEIARSDDEASFTELMGRGAAYLSEDLNQ